MRKLLVYCTLNERVARGSYRGRSVVAASTTFHGNLLNFLIANRARASRKFAVWLKLISGLSLDMNGLSPASPRRFITWQTPKHLPNLETILSNSFVLHGEPFQNKRHRSPASNNQDFQPLSTLSALRRALELSHSTWEDILTCFSTLMARYSELVHLGAFPIVLALFYLLDFDGGATCRFLRLKSWKK
jgi:hypothetical protein